MALAQETLYFDNNATTKPVEGLCGAVVSWMQNDWGNPSSVHRRGQQAKSKLEEARRVHLNFFNAPQKSKLVFTSGGTEANNTVLQSAYKRRGTKNTLIISNIEHSCIANTAQFLKKQGCHIIQIPVDKNGQIDRHAYESALTEDVFLVAIMLVNNETGFILPVAELAQSAHEKGIPFLTDVVCAVGKIPIDMTALNVDYITFSSHKFGSLKGTGGIIYRPEARLDSLIQGGPQEGEKRSGTENVIGALASAYAIEQISLDYDKKTEQWHKLRQILKEQIQSRYSQAFFIESHTKQLSQTLSVCFEGLSGVILLTNLDLEGVCASYGSACASGALEVSRVIKNLDLSFDQAKAVIRLSLSASTTEADILEFGRRLDLAIKRSV